MKLEESDLLKINGGGVIRYGILAGLGGLILLLIGVIDGYTNPQKCNG